MEGEFIDADMDEALPSMWPDDLGSEARNQFNMDKPGFERDMLEDIKIPEEATFADFQRIVELSNYSEKGSSQLSYLVKNWEYRQANAVRLLKEELNSLSKQKLEAEQRKLDIIEAHRFVDDKYDDKRSVSILEEGYDIWVSPPKRRNDVFQYRENIDIDAEFDSINYWKQRAVKLDKMLEVSMQREEALVQKLQDNIKRLETQSSPVEELSQILKRADNFLHFVLQNAPVVIGHQDKDLRYRFIYNPFPKLQDVDIIGKSDTEIFSGAGVKESQEFKREVMEKGKPAKREITFETELFGSKTFLIYVEPVFNKAGDTIGVNYMGMDVTDQVIKREKMAKLREDIAVQKAKETELNKTIHITEETMRAKQMLATMSHEIRSPLTGVVGMAEILTNTKLDKEQRQLLDVMISSGDLVLQLINDILDLSKVESGVMKLESTKFRPREVVRHVLQTAAASLKKELILEGHVAENVPIEVVGDVLRIRQILTNLISNAIKFTHRGKVGINLRVVTEKPKFLTNGNAEASESHLCDNKENSNSSRCEDNFEECSCSTDEGRVWLRCDVYDTGIGIPEKALPSLFKKYMQASADHARKYGGTGLGLAICKQLVELMGGQLTVRSKERCGSTFTFVLPYKIPSKIQHSDDTDEDPMSDDETLSTDDINGSFIFKPRNLGTLYASSNNKIQLLNNISGFSDESESISCIDNPRQTSDNDTCNTETVNKSEEREGECRNERVKSSTNCSMSSSNGNISEEKKRKLAPKILLVEDNNINIMVARSMMKQLGHSVDVANTGLEAIRAVQKSQYDLILMDVYMPVMDGLKATRLIRSYEEHGCWDPSVGNQDFQQQTAAEENGHCTKRTPIVAMTANTISESAEDCLANGMDSFVSKPVTLQKLKECLEQYLP